MCKDRLFLSIAIIVFILLVEEHCRRQWDDGCEDSHECGDGMSRDSDRSCGCGSERERDRDDDCGCNEHHGRGRRNGRGSSLPMAHDPFSGRR